MLIEREDEFRALFEGHKLLAYHCTRLLPHEVEGIRARGLRRVTAELVIERIERAHEDGHLNSSEREHLLGSHVFATGNEEHREGQVCLILGRTVFDESASGCAPLLSTWGGECIYWGAGDEAERALQLIGTPSIVAARIDLSVSDRVSPSFPSMPNLFVGDILGIEGRHSDVFLRHCDVPPEDILAIWQPGNPEYDRHPELPRS